MRCERLEATHTVSRCTHNERREIWFAAFPFGLSLVVRMSTQVRSASLQGLEEMLLVSEPIAARYDQRLHFYTSWSNCRQPQGSDFRQTWRTSKFGSWWKVYTKAARGWGSARG